MTVLLQDVRYALGRLWKSPGFTGIAVLTIAIGIAANVSVFSFSDALFLRNVPAKDPEGLVRILAPEIDGEGLFSYPEYAYLRDHAKTLSLLSAHYSTAPLYVTAKGKTGEVQGAVVTSNYFPMLGLHPQLGRFFTSEEDSVPDRNRVAVLGYGFWQRIYTSDPNALGKALIINGQSFDIIGVMQPDFHGVEIGGMPNEIWIPATMIRAGYRPCDGFQPSCTILALMGRLSPGKNTPEAKAEIATLMHQLRASASGFDDRLGISVTPAIGVSGDRNYFLLLTRLLMSVAGLLLLIVCANLGGLLVARGRARYAELAMRQALGAKRMRIVRQLLTESLMLACAGGILGGVISSWTTRLLASFYSVDSEGYQHLFDLRPDANVLIFSVAVTAVTGVLFGLLPAWLTSHIDLNALLKSRESTQTSDRFWSGTPLAAMQVAISLALLVGAGLLVRSSTQLEAGANTDLHNVVGLRLRPELVQYSPTKARTFNRDVVQRLRELPGIESVSLAKGQGLVWQANLSSHMALPGEIYTKLADQPEILHKQVAPDYFATLKIPFIAGRDFNDRDQGSSLPVAIVNETLANRISPKELPLGQTILLDSKPYQIVGTAKDAQLHKVLEAPQPVVYTSYWQDNSLIDARLCVRVIGDPASALPGIVETIASIDSNVPITETMPLIEQVHGVYTDTRVARAVITCAAALGLLLSAIGLYGVIAFQVTQRTREIGVRIALGAQSQQVVRPFLQRGLIVILVGGAGGCVLAFVTMRLLAAWLFGVRPYDPTAFLFAMGTLLIVILLASYIPARRAAKVDPMVALRYE
jgi:predicted permease